MVSHFVQHIKTHLDNQDFDTNSKGTLSYVYCILQSQTLFNYDDHFLFLRVVYITSLNVPN